MLNLMFLILPRTKNPRRNVRLTRRNWHTAKRLQNLEVRQILDYVHRPVTDTDRQAN